MPETPTDPSAAPAPSAQHYHLTDQHVVIPLDYFLRLVDAAARAKYAPPPLPATAAKQADDPAARIGGGAMSTPAPRIHVPGNEWQPKGVAAGEKKT